MAHARWQFVLFPFNPAHIAFGTSKADSLLVIQSLQDVILAKTGKNYHQELSACHIQTISTLEFLALFM